MIISTLTDSKRYEDLHPGFREAFRFLRRPDLATIGTGRLELDGERLYALVMDASGKGRGRARLETHRKYIDIQYVVTGLDVMGWRSADGDLGGEGYDAAKDIEFFRASAVCWTDVPPGHFAVFFPEDAHAPLAGEGAVRKVVVKVLAGSGERR